MKIVAENLLIGWQSGETLSYCCSLPSNTLTSVDEVL